MISVVLLPLTDTVLFIFQAGLIPTPSHIALFDELLKKYDMQKHNSLHETLKKFSDMATVKGVILIIEILK